MESVTFGVSNIIITPLRKKARLPSNVLLEMKCFPQLFPTIAANESQNTTTNIAVIATGFGNIITHIKKASVRYVAPVNTDLSLFNS